MSVRGGVTVEDSFPYQIMYNYTSEIRGPSVETTSTYLLDNGVSLPDIDLNRTPYNRTINPAVERACLFFDFLMEAVVMGLLCLFGFTGNTLSMLCLWKDKSKTATPFLLISLEVADTIFLVTVLILRVLISTHTFTHWFTALVPIFPYLGTFIWPIALMAETGTIYLTILVTVNRYVSVCRPYEASNLCSVQHARKHVILVTLFSIVYNLPRFFEYNIKEEYTGDRVMLISELSDLGRNRVYQVVYGNIMYSLVFLLVPLVTLILLNWKLIKALRMTKKKRAQLLNSDTHTNTKSEDDITLTLIIVVMVFVICQTPALFTQILLSILSDSTKRCPKPFFYYERLSDMMVVVNSSINFIIYCFCSRRFRHILIYLLCKKHIDSPEPSHATRTKPTRVTNLRDSLV